MKNLFTSLLFACALCAFAQNLQESIKLTEQAAIAHGKEHNVVHPIEFWGVKYKKPLKTSLHLHSTTSDGRYSPQKVVELYATAGYDVVELSDHSKTNAMSKLDAKGMVLLSGMEMHPKIKRGNTWHLLAVNVPEDFPVQDKKTDQEAVDAAIAAGGLVFAAHPYWGGFNAADCLNLKGISGIEVFNTACQQEGKGCSETIWDEMLDGYSKRRITNAIAVDDMHNGFNNNWCDIFGGWIMVMSKKRTREGVVDALKNGRWYSTQGPQFTRLSRNGDIIEAEFTPCVKAWGIGVKFNSKFFGPDVVKGEKTITSLRWDLSKIRKAWKSLDWQYVRIKITDEQGRSAWSNPISMDGE